MRVDKIGGTGILQMSHEVAARELHKISAARLFVANPWLADREACHFLNSRLAELGLQEAVDDRIRHTVAGKALLIELHLVFMGLMDEAEIPGVLGDHRLIEEDEVERLYDCLARSCDPEALLRPVVQRAYIRHFNSGHYRM